MTTRILHRIQRTLLTTLCLLGTALAVQAQTGKAVIHEPADPVAESAAFEAKALKLIRTRIISIDFDPVSAHPGDTVKITARLMYYAKEGKKTVLKPLPNKELKFSVDGVLQGVAKTNDRGRATFPYTVPADVLGNKPVKRLIVKIELDRTPKYQGCSAREVLTVKAE